MKHFYSDCVFIPEVSPVTLQLDLDGMYHLETVSFSFKVFDIHLTVFNLIEALFCNAPSVVP